MTTDDLKKILEEHKNGIRANLMYANLHGADLRGTDLRGADLIGADLTNAQFSNANLSGANLRSADLRSANLRSANLRGADLSGANLRSADLRSADLSSANLIGADLIGANLIGADLTKVQTNNFTRAFFSVCPEEGSFVGYKKASDKIVVLEITADAKRSSATTAKCRCNKAVVLRIENLDGTPADISEIASNYDPNFIYKIGEIVEVPDFDENRWNECSAGIHFFLNKDNAIKQWG